MKSKLIIILCLFFLCTIQACKTEKFYVDDLAKQYFGSFNEGSYWIYEDSVGTIDSTWVVSYEYGFTGTKPFPGTVDMHKEKFEYFKIQTNSSLPYNAGEYSSERTPEQTTYVTYLHKPSPFGTRFIAAIQNNSFLHIDSDLIVTELVNYQVNQYLFPKAIKVQESYDLSSEEYIIVVEGIGIVEKQFYGSKSPFKLKRYSIKN